MWTNLFAIGFLLPLVASQVYYGYEDPYYYEQYLPTEPFNAFPWLEEIPLWRLGKNPSRRFNENPSKLNDLIVKTYSGLLTSLVPLRQLSKTDPYLLNATETRKILGGVFDYLSIAAKKTVKQLKGAGTRRTLGDSIADNLKKACKSKVDVGRSVNNAIGNSNLQFGFNAGAGGGGTQQGNAWADGGGRLGAGLLGGLAAGAGGLGGVKARGSVALGADGNKLSCRRKAIQRGGRRTFVQRCTRNPVSGNGYVKGGGGSNGARNRPACRKKVIDHGDEVEIIKRCRRKKVPNGQRPRKTPVRKTRPRRKVRKKGRQNAQINRNPKRRPRAPARKTRPRRIKRKKGRKNVKNKRNPKLRCVRRVKINGKWHKRKCRSQQAKNKAQRKKKTRKTKGRPAAAGRKNKKKGRKVFVRKSKKGTRKTRKTKRKCHRRVKINGKWRRKKCQRGKRGMRKISRKTKQFHKKGTRVTRYKESKQFNKKKRKSTSSNRKIRRRRTRRKTTQYHHMKKNQKSMIRHRRSLAVPLNDTDEKTRISMIVNRPINEIVRKLDEIASWISPQLLGNTPPEKLRLKVMEAFKVIDKDATDAKIALLGSTRRTLSNLAFDGMSRTCDSSLDMLSELSKLALPGVNIDAAVNAGLG